MERSCDARVRGYALYRRPHALQFLTVRSVHFSFDAALLLSFDTNKILCLFLTHCFENQIQDLAWHTLKTILQESGSARLGDGACTWRRRRQWCMDRFAVGVWSTAKRENVEESRETGRETRKTRTQAGERVGAGEDG